MSSPYAVYGGSPGFTNWRIDRLSIRVESAPKAGKPSEVVFYPVDGRCAQVQEPSLQFVQDGPLRGLVTVQLKAGYAKADAVQSVLDYFKCGHLLGYKQDLSVVAYRLRDDVHDRLRLACSRRTLNHKVAALVDVKDCQRLRRVGVHDMVDVLRTEVIVQTVSFANLWVRF